jgi:cytoskeleton protein RodZ
MTEQSTLWPLTDGADLALLREARGLSIEDVAAQLRCQPELVEALESGEATHLAPVYRKGFLKRYLALLDVDEESEVRLLAQLDVAPAPVKTVFETQPRVQSHDRWLRVASYLLASLLVGTLAWQIAHEAARMARVEVNEERASTTESVRVPEAADRPVNASMGGLESLHAPAGSRTADAGARAWEALNATRRAQAALAGGEHLIELEASADSWVEIRSGEEQLEQDLIRGGERRAYRGTGPFHISLGRASAVRLTLNGEEIALEPFTQEDVARLLLNPTSPTGTAAGETDESESDLTEAVSGS